MKTFMSRAALAGLLMGVSVLASAATPAPKGAEVSIVSPEDGATVPQTFIVKFAVKDIALAPAGDVTKNTGHHHLLIDADELPAAGAADPGDANHRALRQGADPGRSEADAGQAHLAAGAGRQRPHAVRSADRVGEDHRQRQVTICSDAHEKGDPRGSFFCALEAAIRTTRGYEWCR